MLWTKDDHIKNDLFDKKATTAKKKMAIEERTKCQRNSPRWSKKLILFLSLDMLIT